MSAHATLLHVSIVLACASVSLAAFPKAVPVTLVQPTSYPLLRRSRRSSLHSVSLPSVGNGTFPYTFAPYVMKLRGTRFEIGYDYAALFAAETSFVYQTFLDHVTPNKTQQASLIKFFDFLWDKFYQYHVPQGFLDEIAGMEAWWKQYGNASNATVPTHDAHRRTIVAANMPADQINIISALEMEYSKSWPVWLQDLVRLIIDLVEKFGHTCDAYGVWGSRTVNGTLYTSRNLDFLADSGMNRYKVALVYDITEGSARRRYVTLGFGFGLSALAGMSLNGITVSEMNLDNAEVTFSGLPFPLRLRLVLENATDLESAMTIWNSTHNTNSFNFLIGSGPDGQAYALETIYNFTAQFPANSPIEAAATYDCGEPPFVDKTCEEWTPEQPTGIVQIGFPLPEAVWRTNHGMNPVIMQTQEPLFNNTIARYNLMHNFFKSYGDAGIQIDDEKAVQIAATLGIRGFTPQFCIMGAQGWNILSVVYVPQQHHLYVAWEEGSNSTWLPAGCAPYVRLDLKALLRL